MTTTWVASESHLGSTFAMLLCAQTNNRLHVALEGPPLHELLIDTPVEPQVPSLLVEGEQWRQEGTVSFGPASPTGSSFDRTLILATFAPPPEALSQLSIALTDGEPTAEERAVLFATAYARHSGALPGSDLWQPTRSPAPQDYQLLGAAQGRDLFYVFCEGPAVPVDQERTGAPIALTYTLFFDDDDQQPPPGVTMSIGVATTGDAARALLLVTVPRRKRSPREFSVKLAERVTRRTLFEIEAQRV